MCFTGCDSVSSFNGIGKRSAFKILKEKKEKLIDLFEFGDNPILHIQSEFVETCISFVCSLYDKGDTCDINSLRYKFFTQKNKSAENLPPTLDALILHLKRACYQTFIWKQACQPELNLPSPDGNGWYVNNGVLSPEYMVKPPVPESTIELVCCKCKKGCKTGACSCRKSNLSCTDVCQCHEIDEDQCHNMQVIRTDDDSDEDENPYE